MVAGLVLPGQEGQQPPAAGGTQAQGPTPPHCGHSPQELAVVQLVARGHSAGAEHNDLPPILVIS